MSHVLRLNWSKVLAKLHFKNSDINEFYTFIGYEQLYENNNERSKSMAYYEAIRAFENGFSGSNPHAVLLAKIREMGWSKAAIAIETENWDLLEPQTQPGPQPGPPAPVQTGTQPANSNLDQQISSVDIRKISYLLATDGKNWKSYGYLFDATLSDTDLADSRILTGLQNHADFFMQILTKWLQFHSKKATRLQVINLLRSDNKNLMADAVEEFFQ